MISLKQYKSALLFAVFFHCVLALCFYFYHFSANAGVANILNETYVSTYSVVTTHSDKPVSSQGVPVETATSKVSPPDSFQGNNALLSNLHNAIKSNLQYPRAAVQLHQEGSVRVALCLMPSGEISNERIIGSSGFERLDDAAITAVRHTKFKQGEVSVTQCFDLPITFALVANNPL